MSTKSGEVHLDLINNYDKDGNFVNMKRYGSANNLVDNFSYTYFRGTNKLQKVTGQMIDDYSYDANGNQTLDEVNRNKNFKYDSRNLMTEFRGIRQESGLMGLEDKTYMTLYKYDESGNRTRKVSYKYTGSAPDPEFDLSGDTPPWQLVLDEFYVRDISGKEVAIYSGSSLTQWNMWGLDNVGKINADTTKYYYLKDHLGTMRVVLNSTNQVVSANDYDAWGYQMQNRSYQSTNTMYKFTGKERDNESSYDYFGARYYDSRVANWGSVDPLLEKHFDFSPYNYVLRSPLILFDPNGMQENAILTFFSNMLDEAVSAVRSANNISITPWSMFLSIVLNPQSFGYAELKDMKRFYPGPEGYLEYPNELTGITVIASRNYVDIYIPDEDKIPLDELIPPTKRGRAPRDKETGMPIEIHHEEQNPHGPFKEKKWEEHRGKDYYKKLHDANKKSEIDRNEFTKDKREYWKREWDSGRFKKP